MITEDEFYSNLIKRHTKEVHNKINSNKIAIAGIGGLGSYIAVSLARAGIGGLLLVDFDKVDISNLNRQHYSIKHIGKYKTEALKEQIKEINPFTDIKTLNKKVTSYNAADIFGQYKIVIEAFDIAEQKAMIVNTLLSQCKNTKIISASGMAGYKSANDIITKKINNRFYISGDFVTESDNTPLMPPRVMVCAGHEANMALRIILDETNP